MMVRINLLPHREEKRKQKRAAFTALMALGALLGAAVVLIVGGWNASKISIQGERNGVIRAANVELDKKIGQIVTLKEEIEALEKRQQAVEDLQSDRNQPVYLLDELVRQTPEGVYLKAFRQEGQRVTVSGYAQSQERVAELLRNLSNNSAWLERPDLTEVRAATLAQSKTGKKVVEFTLVLGIKRPRDKDAAAKAALKPGQPVYSAAAAPAAAAPAAPAAK
jgi:type IV pilus assembly protein PilN